jgi:hypothetical protein
MAPAASPTALSFAVVSLPEFMSVPRMLSFVPVACAVSVLGRVSSRVPRGAVVSVPRMLSFVPVLSVPAVSVAGMPLLRVSTDGSAGRAGETSTLRSFLSQPAINPSATAPIQKCCLSIGNLHLLPP